MLEKKYKQLNDQLIRATTLRDESMRKLKEDFQCNTLEEARAMLIKLEDEIKERESKLERKVTAFERRYREALQ
jgi:hypothetical protein